MILFFNDNKERGFTIVEFLIYAAILTMAIASMSLIMSNIFRVGVRTDVIQEVSHNGGFAMQRMGYTIRGASIAQIQENGQKLSLDNQAIAFYISDKKLIMEENGQQYELTTSRVEVKRLFFEKIAEDSIKIEMEIAFYNPQELTDYEFKSFFTSSFVIKN